MDEKKPVNDYLANMSLEDRKKYGRMGGIKSGETRRRKRKIKDTLEILMQLPLKKGEKVDAEDIQCLEGVDKLNLDAETAMGIAMLHNAVAGDVSAFLAIRDTLGEKPTDKVQATSEVVIINDDITIDDIEEGGEVGETDNKEEP